MNRQFALFSLWTAQALAVLGWLIVAEHGFSSSRLIVLGIALALAIFSAALAFFSRRAVFTLRLGQRESLLLVSVGMILLAPAAILMLRALGETSGFLYTTSAERLTPLACWLTVSAFELATMLVWQNRAEMAESLQPAGKMLRVALICLLVTTLLAFFVSLLPAARKDGSWGGPATPLLEWQILLALLAALLALLSPNLSIRWRGVSLPIEPLIPILIYLFTCLLWLSQPIIPGFFATPPRAPNFEIYPFSDALIYAQYAQSALTGHGFLWPDVPARPLYIAFLTWLHALAGQDYTHVIVLQTLVLAAFPAVLYLVGKELGGRPLGLGLAILAALRDLTANIAAPFALNYTYSKLFFSEIPAALLISIFTLLSIRWMRAAHRTPHSALFLGCLLGLAALVRLQSVVLLLAVLPIGFFVIKNRRSWAFGSALIVLGMALTIAPWLVRNAVATGGLVLDNPISQTMTLARRWSGDNGNDLIPQLPNEGMAQYSSRMSALAFESLRQRPAQIISAAIGHFVNSETDNLLLFPARDRINNPAELLWPQHAFWQGNTPQPFVIVYLCLFCLGLAAAWHKNRLVGLLPLVISLIYNAWTALFLSSGDRFLVPVDWAVYFYLFFGLLTLVSLIFAGREHVSAWMAVRYNGEPADGWAGPVSVRGLLLTATFILLLGASLPLTEFSFPKIAPLKAVAPGPGALVFSGRAVYPRFYKANQGEPGTAKLGYGKSDQARLVFYLVGQANGLVIFPIKTSPGFFPNAANVTIYGMQQDGFMQAERITVEQNGKTAQYP